MSQQARDQLESTNEVLDQPLALHPRVALRPEPFGALAYHYDTRRLNFLRSHDLVGLVKSLGDHPTARAAFDATEVDSASWPSYAKALEALMASDFIEPRLVSASPGANTPATAAPTITLTPTSQDLA